ncbi:MAG: hypothetical protein ACI9EP_000764 [Oceanospirillaceae bacterium]|jgi:hypothetical protein
MSEEVILADLSAKLSKLDEINGNLAKLQPKLKALEVAVGRTENLATNNGKTDA